MSGGETGMIPIALIGPAIMAGAFGLIWLLVELAALRRAHPGPLFRPLDFVPALAAWGFVALMVVVAGGAIYPPLVAVVAEPLVCDAGFRTLSRAYSSKPGQYGVSRNFLCAGADGTPHDVTLLALAAATLVYTMAGLAFSALRSLLRR